MGSCEEDVEENDYGWTTVQRGGGGARRSGGGGGSRRARDGRQGRPPPSPPRAADWEGWTDWSQVDRARRVVGRRAEVAARARARLRLHEAQLHCLQSAVRADRAYVLERDAMRIEAETLLAAARSAAGTRPTMFDGSGCGSSASLLDEECASPSSSSNSGGSAATGRRHSLVASVGTGSTSAGSGRKVGPVEKARAPVAWPGASTRGALGALDDARALHGRWLEEHKSDGDSMASYHKFVSTHHAQRIVSVIAEVTASGRVEAVPWATQLLVGALGIESHDQTQALKGELAAIKDERASSMGELAALKSEIAEARENLKLEQVRANDAAEKLLTFAANVYTLNAKAVVAFSTTELAKPASELIYSRMQKAFKLCSDGLQGLVEEARGKP